VEVELGDTDCAGCGAGGVDYVVSGVAQVCFACLLARRLLGLGLGFGLIFGLQMAHRSRQVRERPQDSR